MKSKQISKGTLQLMQSVLGRNLVSFFQQACIGLLVAGACSSPPPYRSTPQAFQKPAASVSGKIASSLYTVVQRMRHDGLTAANAAVRNAEAYSTPGVRVDHTGSIETSISVTTVDQEVESRLEHYQARIQVADATLRIIQAWIPFEHLETIAALPFVLYIRPPSYAIRR
jgi:hypothetical protein